MNGAVHYGHTKRWALDEGFSAADAETVARADIAVDRTYPGGRFRYWSWHFMMAGADIRARFLHRRAVRDRDLVALGESLHCAQDSIAHGVFGHLLNPDTVDIWERRTPAVRKRIENRSRRMLARFLEAPR